MNAKARTNIRTGKIAALPEAIREEVNRRLMDGQHGPEIVDWLNGLPEIQVILAEKFEGKPVLRQNLSYWIRGGHQDWQRARRHAAETRKLVDYTLEHAKANHRAVTVEAAEMAAGMMLGLLAQMSRAFRSGKREWGVISGQSSVIGDQFGPTGSASGCEVATDDWSLVTDNIPASSNSDDERAGTAAKTVENSEAEHLTLEKRLGLMNRAVTGITQLRKREQADLAMELKRERLKQTQEMVGLQRERLKFQVKVHEDRLALQKASMDFDAMSGPRRGGIPPEGMKLLVKDINL